MCVKVIQDHTYPSWNIFISQRESHTQTGPSKMLDNVLSLCIEEQTAEKWQGDIPRTAL